MALLRQWLIALLCSLFLPNAFSQEEPKAENPYRVEAAFLRNFARYVTWPTQAFPKDHSPWRVGVLGQDPFGELLEKTLEGRTEKGRPFEIFRASTLDKLPACHIVFIAYGDAEKRRTALNELRDEPVLTVSNEPDFLDEGGIILLDVKDRILMSVNLDQARAASLTIQTKMLEVSRNVMENGVLRKVN